MAPALIAVALLICWVTGDTGMALWFVAGLGAAALALMLVALLLVALVARLRGSAGVSWRYGAANLARRRAESIVQIVALGLGLSALLLLTILRGDLIDDWRARLPKNAPNYFFVNIPPEDREAFSAMLASDGWQSVADPADDPRPHDQDQRRATSARAGIQDRRGEGLAGREQNLTWSAEIGPDNRITEGHWFTPEEAGKPLVSVATDMPGVHWLEAGRQAAPSTSPAKPSRPRSPASARCSGTACSRTSS